MAGYRNRQARARAAFIASGGVVPTPTPSPTPGPTPTPTDTTAPTLSSAISSQTGSATATIGVTTNEANGTLYFFVSASATPPSATALKTGAGAVTSGALSITSTGAKSQNLTGLTASTQYYTHWLHRDAAGNESAILTGPGFTTAASAAAPYLGLVSSVQRPNTTAGDTRYQNLMSDTTHVIRSAGEAIAPRPVYTHGGSTGTSTVECYIEYPTGTFTRITFNGGQNVATMDPTTAAIADAHSITVPNGTAYKFRTYTTNATGIVYGTGSNPSNYYGAEYGTTAAPAANKLNTGTVNRSANAYMPAAIIGQTTLASFLLLGDSRVVGVNDGTAPTGRPADTGEFMRGLGANFAFTSAAIAGKTASAFISENPFATAIAAQYVTDVISNFGINDIRNSQARLPTLQGYAQTFGTRYATGKRYWLATLGPNTTSTFPATTLSTDGSTTTITATTASPHNLTTGMTVKHSNYLPTTYNVQAAVITVTSPTTYTFTAPSVPASQPTQTGQATDMWSTLANQSPVTSTGPGSSRTQFNDWMRAGGISGVTGYVDTADAWESARNSGLVQVDGTPNKYASDGLHETTYALSLIQALPFWAPANFAR